MEAKISHSCPQIKSETVGAAPSWLGSVLVHLLGALIILKFGYLPAQKSEVVWVKLSNFVTESPPPQSTPQIPKRKNLPELPTKPTAKEQTPVDPQIRPAPVNQQKTTQKQPVTSDSTPLLPKTQPKSSSPLKIQRELMVKRKITSPPSAKTDTVQESRAEDVEEPALPPPPQPEVSSIAPLPLPPENTESPEKVQERYLKANLEGIRKKIVNNLRYPAIARRQGWKGQVQVRFTILPSGQVDNIQMLTSSGYSLLDREALKAIEVAAPFPVPAAVASITLPVTFELK